MAMAVAPAGAVDGQRSSKLVAALSRRSATFLFFSVVVVGAVAVSTRWITTTTTTLQASFPTTAAIPAAAALHPKTQHPNPSRQSPFRAPRPPPAAYSISCPIPSLRRNISYAAKASKSSQTLALALSSSSSCRSSPAPPPATATTTAARSSSNSSCPSYFRFIHEDLRPWRAAGGVTRAMLARARATASFRLVVLRGRAFVQRFRPAFQTRDLFTIWGILQLLRRYPGRVPDLDLMFDCVDWPVVRTHLYRGKHAPFMPPLFRYCGDDRTLDIVFPDWSFWGWPEINIKPWDALNKDLKDGNSKVRWFSREPYAYWKGNAAVATSRQATRGQRLLGFLLGRRRHPSDLQPPESILSSITDPHLPAMDLAFSAVDPCLLSGLPPCDVLELLSECVLDTTTPPSLVTWPRIRARVHGSAPSSGSCAPRVVELIVIVAVPYMLRFERLTDRSELFIHLIPNKGSKALSISYYRCLKLLCGIMNERSL